MLPLLAFVTRFSRTNIAAITRNNDGCPFSEGIRLMLLRVGRFCGFPFSVVTIPYQVAGYKVGKSALVFYQSWQQVKKIALLSFFCPEVRKNLHRKFCFAGIKMLAALMDTQFNLSLRMIILDIFTKIPFTMTFYANSSIEKPDFFS